MIERSAIPLAYLLAGPLADRIFEPMLVADGLLADNIGQLIGVGAGRGIGLLFLGMGLLKILMTLGGYLYGPVRRVEDDLPDMIADEPVSVAM
jgi:hypothetical protein